MNQAQTSEMKPSHRFPLGWLALLTGLVALATIGVTALLVNIFERQQEARTPFVQPPWLKRLYAGYAFSIDYREARGHAYMLYDQEVTERVTNKKQGGACLHCHSSVTTTYRRIGLEAQGKVATPEALASDFNWPAVMEGYRVVSKKPYKEVHAELFKTPTNVDALSHGSADDMHIGWVHPVSCIDCYDP